MGQYDIKCDFCKKKMGETDDMGVSACGGTCKQCHDDYINGKGKKWDY